MAAATPLTTASLECFSGGGGAIVRISGDGVGPGKARYKKGNERLTQQNVGPGRNEISSTTPTALYRTKDHGKSRPHNFNPQMPALED